MANNYSFKPRNRAAAAGPPKQLFGKKWEKLQKLGNGCFGTVYLGQFPDGTKIAAKQIQLKLDTDEQLDAEMKRIAKEIAVLEKVTGEHRNIVRYFGCSFSSRSKSIYLLTQFIEGPTLQSYVKGLSSDGMSEDEARGITKQLLNALVYVHSKGILHKDVKPDNVMIRESDRVVKLIDFGIAGICGHRRDTIGPVMYSAPEVFNQQLPMSTKCDSFSVGLTVYFMVTASHPLTDQLGLGSLLGDLIGRQVLHDLSKPMPAMNPEKFSSQLCEFFQRSTVKDPKDRASCQELMKSAFVSSQSSAQPSSRVIARLMQALEHMMEQQQQAAGKQYTVRD